MSSPLAGAWTLVSDTYDGVAVLTDNYFNITWAQKDRKPFELDETPTNTEAAEAYRTFSSAAGRYVISGAKAILNRIVNRNPSWTGQDVEWDFKVEGDYMTLGPNRWKKVG